MEFLLHIAARRRWVLSEVREAVNSLTTAIAVPSCPLSDHNLYYMY
jgi:hypothetical protein